MKSAYIYKLNMVYLKGKDFEKNQRTGGDIGFDVGYNPLRCMPRMLASLVKNAANL